MSPTAGEVDDVDTGVSTTSICGGGDGGTSSVGTGGGELIVADDCCCCCFEVPVVIKVCSLRFKEPREVGGGSD